MHFSPSGVLFYVGVKRSSSVVFLPDPVVGNYAHLWVSGKAAVNETSARSKMYDRVLRVHEYLQMCVIERERERETPILHFFRDLLEQ